MRDDFDYISSSPADVVPDARVTHPEAAELPTLQRVLKAVEESIAVRLTIDALDPKGKTAISTQLLVNKEIVKDLRKIKLLIESTIGDIKEIENGR